MNTNVGDMPLDIFADYTADTLGQEFPIECLLFLSGLQPKLFKINGYSVGNGYFRDEDGDGIKHNHWYHTWGIGIEYVVTLRAYAKGDNYNAFSGHGSIQ